MFFSIFIWKLERKIKEEEQKTFVTLIEKD